MGKPLRVLMAEDNPADAELIVRELRRSGYELEYSRVDTAADFSAALHPQLDVILSDYSMPGFSGLEGLEIVKARGLHVPFIIISGTIGEDLAVSAMRNGAADYLLKDRLGRLGPAVEHALSEVRARVERLQAVAALRDSEERFRQVVENIHDVFWLSDVKRHRMLYISPAFEKIWGKKCSEQEAAPWAWAASIHEADRDRVLATAASKQAGGSYDEEYRIVRADGSVRWIRDRAFLVLSASDDQERVAGIARDVTAVKEAEKRIREQAALLDQARDAIVVFDLSGEIQYWNAGATRLFGWNAEALGHEIQTLAIAEPALFREALESVLSKEHWNGEISMRTKSSETVLVESRWTLMREESGLPSAVLSINTDITERRKLESQFLRAQRLESIGMLAGGVAHDLNNILGPIMMSAELLKLHANRPPDPSLVETIQLSAYRGAEMVKHVLSFARGIEGRKVAVRPADLFAELQNITRETFPKAIAVRTTLPDGVWRVSGDPTQLHQVLLNLAVNARDAMQAGGMLSLSARNEELDAQFAAMQVGAEPGRFVVLEISDTGSGIPNDALKRIFDPFFTTKEQGKGTGLGLSTCAAITKSHGGFITVDSKPGRGTTFRVHLPAQRTDEEERPSAEFSDLPRGSGEVILVVDDEAALQSIIRQTLETFGYRVMTAAHGAEGVAIFAQNASSIALVLMDLMMPVMDGAAAARAIRHLDPSAKIIGATGMPARTAETDFANAGVQHFLPKPYTADVMLKLIHSVLHVPL